MNCYLLPKTVRTVHIEPTSKCNLLCPQCSRVHDGSVNPNMPLADLTWDQLEPSFTHEFCSNLDHVYFCGNHGDPLASNAFLSILENLHHRGVRKMSVFTNGSLRDPNYFRNLVKLIGPKGKVVFAIDGLADTNHIYRTGSVWAKIEANIKAFTEAGGKARWDYLIFNHNAHQVEDARNLARQWGVSEFRAKSTTQFVEPPVARGVKDIEPLSVKNRRTGISHTITPVTESIVFAETVKKIADEHGGVDQYIQKTDIRCKTKPEGSIFIDFTGRVWPCCWIGSGRFDVIRGGPRTLIHDNLDKKYGNGFNQIGEKTTLSDILHHPFYSNDLVSSWENTGDLKRLWTCGFTCGSKFEPSTGVATPIEKL